MRKFIKLTSEKDGLEFIIVTDLIEVASSRGSKDGGSWVRFRDSMMREDVKEDLDTIYSMLEPQGIDPDKRLVSSDGKTLSQWVQFARDCADDADYATISGRTLRQLLELIK